MSLADVYLARKTGEFDGTTGSFVGYGQNDILYGKTPEDIDKVIDAMAVTTLSEHKSSNKPIEQGKNQKCTDLSKALGRIKHQDLGTYISAMINGEVEAIKHKTIKDVINGIDVKNKESQEFKDVLEMLLLLQKQKELEALHKTQNPQANRTQQAEQNKNPQSGE